MLRLHPSQGRCRAVGFAEIQFQQQDAPRSVVWFPTAKVSVVDHAVNAAGLATSSGS